LRRGLLRPEAVLLRELLFREAVEPPLRDANMVDHQLSRPLAVSSSSRIQDGLVLGN
jgi:hypothetical protein